jgi:hypothetical protein
VSARTRIGLLAVTLLIGVAPAVSRAADPPASCVPAPPAQPNADHALCAARFAGETVAGAEAPTVGPRDLARTTSDTALEAAGLCDATDHAACLLPFPNDFFTVADPTTATGRRVNFNLLAMPRNVAGKPIDPAEWNRNDGFSPGTPVMTVVPGVDLARSGVAPITDPAASLDPDAPIVLLDAATGERHPYWAELDANPTAGEQPVLIVRPAVNFDEGRRYVVALRRMRTSDGLAVPPNSTFAARRDKAAQWYAGGDRIKQRMVMIDPVFGPLVRNGYELNDLFLAWTFTIASERNLTERMLHIRDDAFASLGSATPAFTVSNVTNSPTGRIARTVTGTVTVPSYLTLGGKPTSRFNYTGSADGLPTRLGGVATQDAPFTCIVPRSSGVAGTDPAAVRPARLSLYGHGLLGQGTEVGSDNVTKMAEENDFVFCATDWIGMAFEDVPNIATLLVDMSSFATLPDRAQQGMLNFLFLARLMKKGFAGNAAFQGPGGRSVLDTSAVFYDGNSQGGIMGGALMAVAQDITRGVLGVPAMNYSTLLDRSVDFADYESVFNAAYPSELEREITFGLIQMLWDRGEANGYAHHMTSDPLPGTPAHQVLMHVAYGDHQVANVAAEVEARTIGASTNAGFLTPGRHWGADPGWGIPRIAAYPFGGSAFVYWDSGSDVPIGNNTPPSTGATHGDPHSDPRSTRAARDQKSAFLRIGGAFVDVCGGGPCFARPLAPQD